MRRAGVPHSMSRTRATLLQLLLAMSFALAGGRAFAQRLPEAVPRPDMPGFLARSDFSLMLALLGTSDPRFTAAGGLNADVDVADYGTGRVNLFIDYEGILGNERHAYDLNHGNYVMEVSA